MRSVITSTTTIKDRAGACGKILGELRKLDTNAGVGIDLDCENISTGSGGSMLMVSALGTAVVVG